MREGGRRAGAWAQLLSAAGTILLLAVAGSAALGAGSSAAFGWKQLVLLVVGVAVLTTGGVALKPFNIRLRLPRPRAPFIALGALLAGYITLLWLDLPTAAGTRYWAPPVGLGEVASHWWDKLQALRGWSIHPEGWSWRLTDPPPELGAWLPLAGVVALGAWWVALAWQRRVSVALALLVLIAAGYVAQVAAVRLDDRRPGHALTARIVDDGFTGYVGAAARADGAGSFFGRYDDLLRSRELRTRCGHCSTHPPGAIVFFWVQFQAVGALPAEAEGGLGRGLDRVLAIDRVALPGEPSRRATIVAAIGGQLILLLAALVVLPLFGLARLLGGGAHAVPLAASGLVIPGLILMSPSLDQAYVTFTAALLYLTLRGLASWQHPTRWGLAAGAAFAVGTYLSFGLAVLALPMAALACLVAGGQQGRSRTRRAAAWSTAAGLGAVLPWLLLWGLTGFELPEVLNLTAAAHEETTELRPYWPWVIVNVTDTVQALGAPLVVVALWALFRRRGRVNLYALIFAGTLLVLDLSGGVRSETGRLWLFLAPLALLAVFDEVGKGRIGTRGLAFLLTAQALVLLVMAGRWMTPIG